MEHLLILVVELILWLDRLSQKDLRQLVPNLDQLLLNPAGALATGPVHIGPAKRYASSIFLGLVLAAICIGLLFLLAATLFPPRAFRRAWGTYGLLIVVLLALLLLGSTLLVFYLRRGGRMVLTAAGAELYYRGTMVSCPWALFDTSGQAFRADRDHFWSPPLLLPVSPVGVSLVEAQRDGLPIARGLEVKTTPLWFKSNSQAVFKSLYEVDPLELGELLLHVGRQHGGSAVVALRAEDLTELPIRQPGEIAVFTPTETAAIVEVGADGWITVQLTRLALPFFCCACGSQAAQWQPFRGYVSTLRLGRHLRLQGGPSVEVNVPVCEPCQKVHRRARRKARRIGLLVGLAATLLVGLGLMVWLGGGVALLSLILLLPIGLLLGGWLGTEIGRQRSTPVELERYAPAEGTVALRFRKPEYGELLLELAQAEG